MKSVWKFELVYEGRGIYRGAVIYISKYQVEGRVKGTYRCIFQGEIKEKLKGRFRGEINR